MPSAEHENLVQMFRTQRAAAVSAAPNIPDLRKGYELLGQMMPPPSADVAVTPFDAGGVPCERLVAAGADESRCILYFHGGGYCIGSLDSHRHVAAMFSKAARSPVVNVGYRLAPEHVFPAAPDDALTAYRWVLGQGVQARSIALAGDSAGAGLAVALQVAARDAGLPLPAASAPHSPYVDLVDLGEIGDEALEKDYLRPETLDLFSSTYVGDGDPTAPLASPLRADLSGLPPMLIQVGGAEILLDSARRLAAHAKDGGVDVTLEIEPGLVHGWHVFAGALPEAEESILRAGAFLRERFA